MLALGWAVRPAVCAVCARRASAGRSPGRSVRAGLLALVVTTMSFLGAYAHTLFWVTAAQTALLLTVVPVLLVLGAPVSLLVARRPAVGAAGRRLLASAPDARC